MKSGVMFKRRSKEVNLEMPLKSGSIPAKKETCYV